MVIATELTRGNGREAVATISQLSFIDFVIISDWPDITYYLTSPASRYYLHNGGMERIYYKKVFNRFILSEHGCHRYISKTQGKAKNSPDLVAIFLTVFESLSKSGTTAVHHSAVGGGVQAPLGPPHPRHFLQHSRHLHRSH